MRVSGLSGAERGTEGKGIEGRARNLNGLPTKV